MRPPIPRFVRWAVVIAVIAALVIAVFQYWDTKQSASGAQGGWTQTEWGPLGPADRDLLIKVRQAGLWEGPSGQLAEQQASSPRVQEVGGLIAAEHADLDAQARAVAAQLGVALPNQPSEQQQGWMSEMAGQPGPDFDRVFVQRLRAAHGKVLPLVAEVRGSTRNELIRSFAKTSAEFVTRHCEYLESTGLVDAAALPDPPVPDSAPAAPQVPAAAAAPAGSVAATAGTPPVGHEQHVSQVAQSTAAGGGNVYLAALVYVAALLAIVGLLCVLGSAGLRARQDRHRPRRAVHTSRGLPARPRHAAHRW
ncbi:MAG: DUF4142 domain-containing protein [Pseudonocardiaceae bacterium]